MSSGKQSLVRVSDSARRFIKMEAFKHDITMGEFIDLMIEVYKGRDSNKPKRANDNG